MAQGHLCHYGAGLQASRMLYASGAAWNSLCMTLAYWYAPSKITRCMYPFEDVPQHIGDDRAEAQPKRRVH
jgi:hypothetical protein